MLASREFFCDKPLASCDNLLGGRDKGKKQPINSKKR
jgi:hypothetical protein